MKKLLLLGIILFSTIILNAQHLKIEKEKSQLYITHHVVAKETLYSLGRLYNLSPRQIADANKLKADAGLQIGQYIRIPLKKTNFVQANKKKQKELVAVYHTVKKGENLSKLSKNYNSVKEAELKRWNHLAKNTIKAGQDIIVGYIKISPQQEKQEPVATKISPKKNIDTPAENNFTINQVAPPKEAPIPVPGQDKKQLIVDSPATKAIEIIQTSSGDESFFAGNYSVNAANAQEKKMNGIAATFKSTSGWNDKKYYILINGIAPETIVKITCNGKSVYAKVLEMLPELKDNKGLICRLSNAAASALGIADAKFEVEIAYYE